MLWTIDELFNRSTPEPNSGCWIWLGATSHGYGAIRIAGKTVRAHRLAHRLASGVLTPSSLDVCHRCDLRSCVNPDHLFVGTRADNMRDCASKNRIVVPALSGDDCPNSKLTSSQVAEIRADTRSSRAIGRAYGVHKSTINYIKRGSTWKSAK